MEKTIDKYIFSTTENLYSKELSETTLEQVFKRITCDQNLETLTNRVRETVGTNKYREMKLKLPAIIPAGSFSERKIIGLIKLSEIISFDFDKLEDVKHAKDELLQLDFICGVYVSPSGKGLKIFIKIDASNPEEFREYFFAIENYFQTELKLQVDKACKDISRACLICYDKEAYLNNDSKVLKKDFIQEWRVKSNSENHQGQVVETTIERVESWESKINRSQKDDFNSFAIATVSSKIEKADDGEKHKVLLSQSNYLGYFVYHGIISYENAKKCLLSAISKRKVDSLKDAEKTIESGLAHGMKNPVKGEDLGLYNNQFWRIFRDGDGKTKIYIPYTKMYRFLAEKGYWIFKKDDTYVFVKIKNNIIYKVDKYEMINFVLKYIQSLPYKIQEDLFRDSLEEAFRLRMNNLFSDKQIHTIEHLHPNFVKDTADVCHVFYNNGVLKITKSGYELVAYKDIEGYIWSSQVLDRDFHSTELNFQQLCNQSEFGRFIKGVSGNSKGENIERNKSMHSILGYLLHSYKDPKLSKAIIFCDEAISESPEGGVGKSIAIKSLDFFKSSARVDGKNFKFSSQFAFQRVELDTKILVFEDVEKKFPFEKLFAIITEGIGVEKKNKDKFFIEYEDSPKIVLTTNYMIDGQGNSHDRRRLEFEFAQHYNKHHTPFDEFGHSLFNDWTQEEWILFDNFMIGCCQQFLQNGLLNPPKINIAYRKVVQSTCEEFAIFMNNIMSSIVNSEVDKTVLRNSFIEKYEEYRDYKWFSSRLFYRWLRKYGEFYDFKVDERVSNNKQLIRFSKK